MVIDPAGIIPPLGSGLPSPPEKGTRPFGDTGVVERVGLHVPGGPNPLDDNRGWYRVTKVNDSDPIAPALEVNQVTDFTGTVALPVVFAQSNATRAYAVYPTVTASQLAGQATEDQMALRPTRERDPVTGSFQNYSSGEEHFSMQPFSYKVIRPTQLFSDEAIDLVLSTRERMLSWIEELRSVMRGDKGGSYFVFQRDQHSANVGSPTDPELGMGVFFNLTIQSLIGEIQVAPFLNTSDCLSLLDRRTWILDTRLDSLEPDPADPLRMRKLVPPGPAYTAFNDTATGGGEVRPVLTDRITEVLDSSDRLRPLRYTWLSYRTHRTLGTLASILRFDRELPERMAEQQRLLMLLESTEKVQ